MPVRHLDWTNTAAVGSLRTRQLVDHLSIQPSLRELVQRRIPMHMMMEPALLHARLMNIPSCFAPMLTGNFPFSHPTFFSTKKINFFMPFRKLKNELVTQDEGVK